MSDDLILTAKNGFQAAITHMKDEFKKLQIGRASAALVEGVMVEMYGTTQPLKALANISVPEAKTLSIQPWDRSALTAIEKGIVAANIGLNPVNNGVAIILNMPPLTEERRTEVAKRVRSLAEEAKISVRNFRQDALNAIKKMKDNDEATEDDVFSEGKKLQEFVDAANKEIEETAKAKESDIMTV
ncbi:MAG: ribosome recycling factor [Candidatus Gracilibacteria bacterium]